MRGKLFLLASLFIFVTTACTSPEDPPAPSPDTAQLVQEDAMTARPPAASLTLSSPAFVQGAAIPVQYTCDGADQSPPLAWTGAPDDVQSFALIMDDPDAPAGTWEHWLIFNIPASTTDLPAAVATTPTLADGSIQGTNSWRRVGYGGPCPPSGQHRYFFKFYALDAMLSLRSSATKADLLQAMEGHILAQSELMGVYRRR